MFSFVRFIFSDVLEPRDGDLPSAEVAADGGTVLQVYYDRNSYVAYFYANGGSYTDSQVIRYGAAVAEPADPTRAGYTFGGWYDESLTQRYDFSKAMPAEDVHLYAKWNPRSSVSYLSLIHI